MPIIVREMQEIDDFFDQLDPNIEVIWGISTDNELGEDAKVTILATGMEDDMQGQQRAAVTHDDEYYESMIPQLYKPIKRKGEDKPVEPKMEVVVPPEPEPAVIKPEPELVAEEGDSPFGQKKSVLEKMRRWLESMMADTELNEQTDD